MLNFPLGELCVNILACLILDDGFSYDQCWIPDIIITSYILQVSFPFCWWQRGRKVMTCTILIAWLIWISKACVIWMSYMPCKMPCNILENIARLIDHIESLPYIYIMKFMLKIFISYRSKNCLLSFYLKMIFIEVLYLLLLNENNDKFYG